MKNMKLGNFTSLSQSAKSIYGLLVLHCASFFCVIIDLIPSNIEFEKNCCVLNVINKLISFQTCGDLSSPLIGIWAFIIAVFVFYLEKKDETFCGINIWQIATFDIKKAAKIIFFILFFIELEVILVSIIIDFSLTTMYYLFLYPLTILGLFAFVWWATEDITHKKRYQELIIFQYTHNKSESLEERIPALIKYLKRLPHLSIADLDQLSELLSQILWKLYFHQDINDQQETKRTLYQIIRYILNTITNADTKKVFCEYLGAFSCETVKPASPSSVSTSVGFLTPLFLASLEQGVPLENYHSLAFLSKIKDEEIRRQLLFRGIIYTTYLSSISGASKYKDIKGALQIKLNEDVLSEKNQRDTVMFLQKIQEYAPDFTMDTFVKHYYT